MSNSLRKWIITFAVLSLCLLAIGSSLTPHNEKTYLVGYYGNFVGGLPEMTNDSELSQQLNLTSETMYLSVLLSKQDKELESGSIHVSLYEADGKLLYESTESVSEGVADQEIFIYQLLNPGEYRLVLSFTDFSEGEYMFAYLSSESDELGELTINGETVDGQLYLKSATETNVRAVPWLAVAIVLVLLVLLAWRKEKMLLRACASGTVACVVFGGLSVLLQLHGQTWHAVMLLLELAALVLCALVFTTGRQHKAALDSLRAAWNKHARSILLTALLLVVCASVGTAAELVTDESFLWPRAVFFASFAFVTGFHILFWKELRHNISRSFLLTAIVLGLMMAVFAPTILSSWDDETHYERVLRLSGGPITFLSGADNSIINRSVSWTEYSLAQRAEDAAILESSSKFLYYSPNYSAWKLARFSYLPQVIGIWLGQILGASVQITYNLGRCTNLIFYVLVIYAAMKKLRGGQLLVYVYGLIPTGLFLGACYTYDAWVNCLTVYGFCCFVGAMQRPEKYTVTRETYFMLAVLIMGFVPKAVYTPMILLLLLAPKSKFADTRELKRFVLAVLGATVIGVCIYLIPFLFRGAFSSSTDARGGSKVNSVEQVKYILSNPLQYAATLLKFLKSYLSPLNGYNLTTSFAYSESADLSIPVLALLAAAALTDRSKADRTLRKPNVIALTLVWQFAITSLVATALYITFTSVGLDTINGCQLRYRLPIIFPAWLLAGNLFTLPQKARDTARCVIFPAMALLAFACVWSGFIAHFTV